MLNVSHPATPGCRRLRLVNPCLIIVLAAVFAVSRPAFPQTRPIHLVGALNSPPLSFAEDGVSQGFSVDVARALGLVLGREIRLELIDWHDVPDVLQRGAADGA